ncbi:MAG: multicopper oxidase domain-containing protein [Dehalococcoidia bacterium]
MGSGYRLAAVAGAILGVAALLVATLALGGRSMTGGGEASPAAAKTVAVELGDLFIKPGQISVEKGANVTLKVKNTGGTEHNLAIEGGAMTKNLKSGESADLTFKADKDTYTLVCTIPGHKEGGMVAKLTTGGTGGDHAGMASGGTMTAAQMDESYLAGVKAFPAKTKGQGNVELAPKIQNGVKVFELTADEIDWEVAPGEVHKGMAYNGMIPGPVIKANVGDRIRIVLTNKLEESTAMHFHGMIVPNEQDGVPGITQPLVKPGETYTYEFPIRNSGSNMYHSHMNGAHQIPSGLFGALIIEEPNAPQVSQDLVMVVNDGPLGYTLNGKGFPATAPIVAKRGERIRIRYMNEGLQIHPMHLHGMPQQVIAMDGWTLPQPYTQDTVLVAPGQRVDVLVTASELGVWAFHCHVLSHAENEAGMFGMVTAMIIQ